MQIRQICTEVIHRAKVVPSNLKGKSKSSQEWLQRQLCDPYVEKAKMLNYRCRSAFKLLEIDDKHKIIQPGSAVIDCGAAPGSWSQVAVRRSNADGLDEGKPQGKVVSIDLLRLHPIKGATILDGSDFTQPKTQDKLREILNGKGVDCMLSDMAPNATGVKVLDQEKILGLCYSVLKFGILMSTEGASLLVKLWDSGAIGQLEKDMNRFYESVKRVKPLSSRSDSAELFLLAKGFKGVKPKTVI